MTTVLNVTSTPEGFLIQVSGLDASTNKVVLTVTDKGYATADSSTSSAFTFTKLKKSGDNDVEFVVTQVEPGREYVIIAEERTIGSIPISANVQLATYTAVPAVNFTVPDPQSIDKAFQYIFTDISGVDTQGIERVQFIVSDMLGNSPVFSATMAAQYVFGSVITIDGLTVSSSSGASANNVLSPSAELLNYSEYEVAVIFSNDTGAAANTVDTSKVTPSPSANSPTIVAANTGINLSDPSDQDGKIEIIFTKGTQIAAYPDESYTVKVTDNSSNYFTKIFDSSDNTTILLVHGETGFVDASGDDVVGGLSLVNGNTYSIEISASNSSDTSAYSSAATATPSGKPGALTIVYGSGGGSLAISATTGVKEGHIVFQLDGSLNNIALTNGSDIIGFTVTATLRPGGTPFDSDQFTDSSFSIATDVGEEYDIYITTENANGTTRSTNTPIRTSTRAASISGTITALPALGSKSDLSSNQISLAWPSADWGGYSAGELDASFGYNIVIYNGSGDRVIKSINVSHSEESYTDIDPSFVNGVQLIATITPFNPYVVGATTLTSVNFAPSTEINVSTSVLGLQSTLNGLVKKTFIENGSGIVLGLTSLAPEFLRDVVVNGGYPIDQIKFELVPDNNNLVKLTSDGVSLDIDIGGTFYYFDDRTFNAFSNTNLDLLNNGHSWELRAYYLNAAYPDIIDRTTGPDVTTKVIFSTSKANVTNTSIDASNGEVTVNFVAPTSDPYGETYATNYIVTLSHSRPVLISGNLDINYSGYSQTDISNNIVADNSVAYSHTFTGLTNGINYKATITTVSKEFYGTVDVGSANYQPALDASYTAVVTTPSQAMPFGPPIITSSAGGFTVQANGSSLQDAILITPGSTDNIKDLTSTMINSTRDGPGNRNGDVYYDTADGGPPFGSYYLDDGSKVSYYYDASSVVPSEANGVYFFIVSGRVGHYSILASDPSFNALFPGGSGS
jgi:hypothetical protein